MRFLISRQLPTISYLKLEVLLILSILILAAFLRFYRLSDYMNFLGDEGRDALVVKRILVAHDFPLLGPPTSVGNMYLGPLYYYMMSVPMAVFWLDPVAGASMNAFIGVLTVFLIYYLAKIWLGKKAAFLSSFAYAISPITIIYSRSSWNPNPAPFFSLLAILGLSLVHKHKDFRWIILTCLALAFDLQMHYLALIMIPIVFVLFLIEIFSKDKKKHLFLGTFIGLLVFIFLMSPLLIFDFKYNFLNLRSLLELFYNQNSAVSFSFLNNINRLIPTYSMNLISRYLAGQNYIFSSFLSLLILVPIGYLIYFIKTKNKFNWLIFVSFFWLTFGLLGLSFYKDQIYDHYLGFMNPAPYLLLGGLIYYIPKSIKMVTFFCLLIAITLTNFLKSPLLNPPNRQLFKTQEIAKYVISKSENKPFNFALIAARNYDSAYQFYLYRFGHPSATLPSEKTDQLFVVCEDVICDPVNNSKFEISAFGMSRIEQKDEILGVSVFKLVPNPSGKPS